MEAVEAEEAEEAGAGGATRLEQWWRRRWRRCWLRSGAATHREETRWGRALRGCWGDFPLGAECEGGRFREGSCLSVSERFDGQGNGEEVVA